MANLIERLDSRVPCLGILFILASSFFACGGKFAVKKLDVNASVIVAVRCGILSFIWLIIVAIRRDYVLGQSKKELNLLILRGFLGWLTFILSYFALSYIPLADATTIILSSPIYTSVFGYFILKEKCGPINIGLIILTLAGVCMIARPSFIFGSDLDEEDEESKTIGITLAFLSSIIQSLNNIVIRKLKGTAASVVVTWFAFVSFVCSIIVIIVAKISLPFDQTITIRVIDFEYELIVLLLNAMCGIFAQLFITLALKVEEAGTISLARSVDILLSFIVQALLLKNEPILYTSVIGALVIAVGVTLSALNKIREKRKQEKEPKGLSKDLDTESNNFSSSTDKIALPSSGLANNGYDNQYLTKDNIKNSNDK